MAAERCAVTRSYGVGQQINVRTCAVALAPFITLRTLTTSRRCRSNSNSRAGPARKGAPFLAALRYSRLSERDHGPPLLAGP